MADLKYMPIDPDRWGEMEAEGEDAKALISRNIRKIMHICGDNAVLVLANEELADTNGGVGHACLTLVVTALIKKINDPSDTMLDDIWEALVGVDDWHRGDDEEDEETQA